MTIATETIYRVHDEEEGVYLEIGDYPDNPKYLALSTDGAKNVEWYGPINISLTPEHAEKLGQALIAAAAAKRNTPN